MELGRHALHSGQIGLYINHIWDRENLTIAACPSRLPGPFRKVRKFRPGWPSPTSTIALSNNLSGVDEHDLSLSQFEVLANLYFYEGIRQNDLARQLLVTKGNVCGLIDRLAAAGLVERRDDPADGRANQLFLTPSGTKLIETSLPVHLRIIRERLGVLPVAN